MQFLKITLSIFCLTLLLSSCGTTTVFFENFHSSEIGQIPSTDLPNLPEGDSIHYKDINGIVTMDSVFGTEKILSLNTDEVSNFELFLKEIQWGSDDKLKLTITGAFESFNNHKLNIHYTKGENVIESASQSSLRCNTAQIGTELDTILVIRSTKNNEYTLLYEVGAPFVYTITYKPGLQKYLEYTLISGGVSKTWSEKVDIFRPFSYRLNWSKLPNDSDVPNSNLMIDDIIVVNE